MDHGYCFDSLEFLVFLAMVANTSDGRGGLKLVVVVSRASGS
jgi:hypothetical protein